MNKSSNKTSHNHTTGRKTSQTSKPAQRKTSQTSKPAHSKNVPNKDTFPYMTKKVKISQEKLMTMTKKVYNNSGADNRCEAKSIHLLCRAVNSQFNSNNYSNSLCTLQSNFEEKFNPQSEAWKHAFILVISYLKKYQMELSLATVIVETPKEIESRTSQGYTKIPFPINVKRFSSPESVSRIFYELMKTRKSISNKTFSDKLNEFIENMEMEDFWQRNPLLAFPGNFTPSLSAVSTSRSSAIQMSSVADNKIENDEDVDKKDAVNIEEQNNSDNINMASSSTKKGKKKKERKEKESLNQ